MKAVRDSSSSIASQETEVAGLRRERFLGAVHWQHEPVGVPVTEQISPGRNDERDQGAAAAADQVPDRHK